MHAISEGTLDNTIRLKASVRNLPQLMAFVSERMEAWDCSLRARLAVELAAEEVFVNIANYAYAPGSGEATVRVELETAGSADEAAGSADETVDVADEKASGTDETAGSADEAAGGTDETAGRRAIVVTFMDQGKPYDPLSRDDPDLTQPASRRQIGGLGIFLVKQKMDHVSYEYRDGSNVLTIKKYI